MKTKKIRKEARKGMSNRCREVFFVVSVFLLYFCSFPGDAQSALNDCCASSGCHLQGPLGGELIQPSPNEDTNGSPPSTSRNLEPLPGALKVKNCRQTISPGSFTFSKNKNIVFATGAQILRVERSRLKSADPILVFLLLFAFCT